MELARIGAANDVVAVVREAVERGLKSQGFGIGAGGLAVDVELQAFYNDFNRGLGGWTETGEVAFALTVSEPGGRAIYARNYRGVSVRGFFVSTPANAKESLEKALNRAIQEMLEDKALQQALLRS